MPLVLCSALTLALTACGLGLQPAASSARLAGKVHGGQQPVGGVSIQLYAVGTAGPGSASTALLPSPSLSAGDGSFGFAGFTCPTPGTLVYLAGTGGSPIPGIVNPNLSLMVALGPCGDITTQTYVSLNEITSVAAVDALAPYMSATNAIGSSPAQASALADAFTLAASYANPASGSAPGTNPPAGLDAALHSSLILERRGALISWTILLAILTFSLSLVGTFLVPLGHPHQRPRLRPRRAPRSLHPRHHRGGDRRGPDPLRRAGAVDAHRRPVHAPIAGRGHHAQQPFPADRGGDGIPRHLLSGIRRGAARRGDLRWSPLLCRHLHSPLSAAAGDLRASARCSTGGATSLAA